MINKFSLPSSFGESSDAELILIFVGEDVGEKFLSRINLIKRKSSLKKERIDNLFFVIFFQKDFFLSHFIDKKKKERKE